MCPFITHILDRIGRDGRRFRKKKKKERKRQAVTMLGWRNSGSPWHEKSREKDLEGSWAIPRGDGTPSLAAAATAVSSSSLPEPSSLSLLLSYLCLLSSIYIIYLCILYYLLFLLILSSHVFSTSITSFCHIYHLTLLLSLWALL